MGPTLSPTNAYVGETLTVAQGSYVGGSVTSDQWDRCDQATCSPTGTNGTSYPVTYADVGDTLKVEEIATAVPDGSTIEQYFNQTSPVPGPPTNVTPPAIDSSPAPVVGNTLTATQGTWTSADVGSISDTWEDCDGSTCTPIPGTTTTTPITSYTLTSADVGHTIEVVETATNGGTPANPPVSSAPTGLVQTPIALTVSPSSPVTNQPTTLVATVSSATPGTAPAGWVQFAGQGKPISGCSAVPVQPSAQIVTAVCQASFAAGSVQLTATFTPDGSSLVLGSSSPVLTLNVGRDTATATLDASGQVPVDATTTYTATVAPATAPGGPIRPSGSVEFLDGGKPIAGCTARPVASGGATCTIRYSVTGSRSIVARYLGDANFAGSSSPATAVRITPLSVKGTITSTMQWTFSFAPTYTRVINMVINGVPTGATVQTLCHGRGCPFAKRSTTVGKAKPCTGKRKRTHSCPVHGRVSLTAPFGDHKLHPGAQITIEIRRPRFVGKYYSFTVRARRQPGVRIGCLAPGGTRPNVGC
jgi:Bacterial Ig-like domain (group 3)